jgi:hypothetical protein
MTVEKISRAYGISVSTVNQWRKRGIALDDFRDPQLVSQRLAETARNRSPMIEALLSKQNQLHIAFRLAVSGAISPKK